MKICQSTGHCPKNITQMIPDRKLLPNRNQTKEITQPIPARNIIHSMHVKKITQLNCQLSLAIKITQLITNKYI